MTTKEMILGSGTDEVRQAREAYNAEMRKELAMRPSDAIVAFDRLMDAWETVDRGWALAVDNLLYDVRDYLPAEITTPTGLTNNRIKAEFAIQGSLVSQRSHTWVPVGISNEEDHHGYLLPSSGSPAPRVNIRHGYFGVD